MKISQVIDFYSSKHPEIHRELVSTRILSYFSENGIKFYKDIADSEYFQQHSKKLDNTIQQLSKTHGYKK